jgi:uncharacterized membrane protein (DUF485 family)
LWKKMSKVLQKKAKWKGFNSKTRRIAVSLLTVAIFCLIFALACVIAVKCEAPAAEIFQPLGLFGAMAWVMLTALSLVSNAAGAMISRAERYRRLHPAMQKSMRGLPVMRLSVACAASYHAGHGRAHRSSSRCASFSATKDSSDDGESDSGDPAKPLSALTPFFSLCSSQKSNSVPASRCFLHGPGCWRMLFSLPLTERG